MDWDVLFNGSSIVDKVTSFVIIKGRGRFCKEFSLEVADYFLKTSIDLANMSEDPSIEIRTNTSSGWISEGAFFIEQCTPIQSKDAITLSLWGRDESAKLTQPFAKRMYKEYDEDTSLYEIIEEILTEYGIEYDEDRMLIDDFVIYANAYSVQGLYPIEVLQQLVSITNGFIYTDRLGQLWVVKDEYHWDAAVTEIDETVIESISEREDYPEFGNRVRVGSYADDGEIDASVSLQVAQSYVAVGEGVIAKAIVTRKDGTLFPDGYKVQWTSDNKSYASWEKDETAILTHRILNERQAALSTRMISVDYPIRQVHSVTVVSTGNTIDVKEHEGISIVLDDDLPFTDSVVVVDYSTAYATNTLTGGSIGEVEVDVHAIVEVFVRDTQTIRVDTTAGFQIGEEAAYVTIIQRDFITKEIITNPGNVRLDDILKGVTEDGIIDLGLVPGGDHPISIRDVSSYKDTDAENEGLANDEIRVGQTVYTLSDGEETTNPNLITDHNDLSNIQGGIAGQRYHLSAAELAALHTRKHALNSVYDHDPLAGDEGEIITLTAGGMLASSGEKLAGKEDAGIAAAIMGEHEVAEDPHIVYSLDSEVLKKNGEDELTGDWDIGAGRVIELEKLRTRADATNFYIEDHEEKGYFLLSPNGAGIKYISKESYGRFDLMSYSDTAGNGNYCLFYRARGTEASPAAVVVNDLMFTYDIWGRHAAGASRAGQLGAAVEAIAGANIDAYWRFLDRSWGTLLAVSKDANVFIGLSHNGYGSTNTLFLKQATVPSSMPANSVAFYGKDVGGTTEACAQDEATNEAQITAHSFKLFNPDPGEQYPFCAYYRNRALGMETEADMTGALRAVERLMQEVFGEERQFIFSRPLPAEEVTTWEAEQDRRKQLEDASRREQAIERLMAEEIEVVPKDAVEEVDEIVTVPGKYEDGPDEYILDQESGEVKKRPTKIPKKTKTGRKIFKLKQGYELKDDGSIIRHHSKAEAEAEATFSSYIRKDPPAWMVERLVVEERIK